LCQSWLLSSRAALSKVAAFGLDVTFAAGVEVLTSSPERRHARLARPANQCPLYPQKRTLVSAVLMSALCQKQTFCTAVKNVVIRSPRRRAAGDARARRGPKPWQL
jgi:hypothetical protein